MQAILIITAAIIVIAIGARIGRAIKRAPDGIAEEQARHAQLDTLEKP